MTDPLRDVLAKALTATYNEAGSMSAIDDDDRRDADAIIAALASEGWVLVNTHSPEYEWHTAPDPAPLDVVLAKEARRRDRAEAEVERLREAATRFVHHVQEVSCDHAPHRGTHTSCPEVLALVATLAPEDRP